MVTRWDHFGSRRQVCTSVGQRSSSMATLRWSGTNGKRIESLERRIGILDRYVDGIADVVKKCGEASMATILDPSSDEDDDYVMDSDDQ